MDGLTPIFDLDGTLLDSDAALVAAFVALGVPPAEITFGHVPAVECRRLGIAFSEYAAAYDTSRAQPYPGVAEVLAALEREGRAWGLCSNKHAAAGRAEVARLGWGPRVALFSEDFGGPKHLAPVLAGLGGEASQVIFVGDTDHDRDCAQAVGAAFALAGWNPRALARSGDTVLASPGELLEFLGRRRV